MHVPAGNILLGGCGGGGGDDMSCKDGYDKDDDRLCYEHGADEYYEMTMDKKVFTDAACSGEPGGGGDSGLIYKIYGNYDNYDNMCIDGEHGADDYDEMNMGVSVMIGEDYENFDNLSAGIRAAPAAASYDLGGSDGYVLQAKRAQKINFCCVASPPSVKRAQSE